MQKRQARRHVLRIMLQYAEQCAQGIARHPHLSDGDKRRVQAEFDLIVTYYRTRLRVDGYGPRRHQPAPLHPSQMTIEDVPA
jgi:hypothetical protein